MRDMITFATARNTDLEAAEGCLLFLGTKPVRTRRKAIREGAKSPLSDFCVGAKYLAGLRKTPCALAQNGSALFSVVYKAIA